MRNQYKFFIKIYVVFIFLFISKNILAQSLESPLLLQGGADIHIYKSSTIILENIFLDEGRSNLKENDVQVGITQFYSPFVKFLFFPFSYAYNENLEFNFTLPYLSKSLIENSIDYEKGGYGDLKIGSLFKHSFIKDFISFSHIKITFPTGNEIARDGNRLMPLGYGTNTFSFLQTFSFPRILGLRFYINGAIVYYLKTHYEISSTEKYSVPAYYLLSGLLGCDYNISKLLQFQLKANYIQIPRRTFKFENTFTGTTTNEEELYDSINCSDIITGFKFHFQKDLTGKVLFSYPVYDKQDKDIEDPYDRSWKLLFSFQKTFQEKKEWRRKPKRR